MTLVVLANNLVKKPPVFISRSGVGVGDKITNEKKLCVRGMSRSKLIAQVINADIQPTFSTGTTTPTIDLNSKNTGLYHKIRTLISVLLSDLLLLHKGDPNVY